MVKINWYQELDMDVSVVDGHQVEPLIELVGTLKKKYKALEEIKNKRIAQCKKLLAKVNILIYKKED